jgi:hypothetical protein
VALTTNDSRRSRNLISIHNGMPTAISNAVQTSKLSTAVFMCIDYRHRRDRSWTNVTTVGQGATGNAIVYVIGDLTSQYGTGVTDPAAQYCLIHNSLGYAALIRLPRFARSRRMRKERLSLVSRLEREDFAPLPD